MHLADFTRTNPAARLSPYGKIFIMAASLQTLNVQENNG
jgi:hypothetical protein